MCRLGIALRVLYFKILLLLLPGALSCLAHTVGACVPRGPPVASSLSAGWPVEGSLAMWRLSLSLSRHGPRGPPREAGIRARSSVHAAPRAPSHQGRALLSFMAPRRRLSQGR